VPKQQPKTSYLCRACGARTVKWAGRCPTCGEWGTLEEAVTHTSSSRTAPLTAEELSKVSTQDYPRLVLPFAEVNRVLGGGIVPGSLVLIGGDPGIGKSTLLLHLADAVARTGQRVAYISGEESAHQLRLRAQRLGIEGYNLFVLAETALGRVLDTLDSLRPRLVIVDSIQTMYLEEMESGAGSVAQVRECCLRLLQWAKEKKEVPVFLTGHVTKEGTVAGPRTLEHMVDAVAYLEGDAFGPYRILRCTKNRFGSTNEIAVLEMREAGLVEVSNPSQVFLSQRARGATGSAVVPVLEGTRPLLVEVQALVHPTPYGTPRRTANGLDFNRLILVCAVLTRQAGIPLATQDVIANVAGGLRLHEPAADLAAALAIASSAHNAPVKEGLAVVGEVGLAGELRPVLGLERRIAEAARLGFTTVLIPSGSELPPVVSSSNPPGVSFNGVELARVGSVREALRQGLVGGVRRARQVAETGTSEPPE
jgi:DNA repair protein RadA/Sms